MLTRWRPRPFRRFCLAALGFGLLTSGPIAAACAGDEDEFSLDLPASHRLFRLESEAEARASIRRAAAQKQIKKVEFPPDADPPYVVDTTPRPPQVLVQESTEVCFPTLYFQDVRTERLGLSCGVLEPARSALLFYGRTITLPLTTVVVPPWRLQCWQPE